MNQIATLDTATLVVRMYNLTFKTLLALCVEAKGGPLGFDPNRGPGGVWQGGDLKPKMAGWAVQNLDNAKLAALLPAYEAKAKNARAWVERQNGGSAKPRPSYNKPASYQTIPMDPPQQATNTPEPAPQTALHNPPSATKDEGATVTRVREIAREEASALDETLRAWIGNAEQTAADAAERAAKLAEDVDALKRAQGMTIILQNSDGQETQRQEVGRQHRQFETLLRYCSARGRDGHRLNPWLAGPAGSGKSSAAVAVARSLGLEFYFTGAIKDEFKLFGFTDAQGKTVITQFRKAWENGGVFLFDEIDGSDEAAVLALNAALANGMADFPDGTVYRHRDCIVIAAANTWGSGATHEYVGRTKLDAASKDRFIDLSWEYDEDLERDTSGNVEWARKVQRYRANAARAGVRCVISPRATYNGAAMLAAGIPEDQVLMATITAKLTPENARKVVGGY